MTVKNVSLAAVLSLSGLFGSVLLAPHYLAGAALAVAMAAYMCHFRTFTNDWTRTECWFNLPLAIVPFLGVFFGAKYPLLHALMIGFASGFVGIYIVGVITLLFRRSRG